MIFKRLYNLLERIKGRLLSERNRLWKNCDIDHIALRGYRPALDAIAFKNRLQYMLGSFDASLLYGISEDEKKTIINSAEQSLDHIFDLLGSGPMKNDPIDWHIDFKSGFRWGKEWYLDISHIKGADIKVPWELSRCQHLLWLGEAFLLTNDKKYAQEVIDEINWWIDDNPLMHSVNWKCSMDVAFRAVNWFFSLNMISSYVGFNDDFTTRVVRSLWAHGFFIRNNLEKAIPYSNNHYTSDLVGLLYIGILFGQTIKGKRWKQYGLKELYNEVRRQVLDTGVHYERSVSYHRLMAEMLSYPIYMLRRIDEEVPSDVIEKIRKMYEFVANYTKPNGFAPLIGDNDDGRFVPFLKRDFRCHNYLNLDQSLENRIVSAGASPLFCTRICSSQFYSDAGVSIMREGGDYLFVNEGGYSKRPSNKQKVLGTHTHNDLLSFELCLNYQDIIVDPGTFLYTSDSQKRDEFRSTAKHNTIMVDGEEQNGFVAPFMLERNVRKGPLIKADKNVVEGSYYTIQGSMWHRRSFHLTESGLTIHDIVKKSGNNHECKMYYHFAEGIELVMTNGLIRINNDNEMVFSIPPNTIEVLKDTLSPSYGKITDGKVLVVSYRFNEQLDIKTIIRK